MQPLLASKTLAADWSGDAAWQGLWAGSTLKTILISTVIAVAVCSWFLKSRVGLIAGAILGVVGNYFYVHVYQNKGDNVWEQMGSSDGWTFFVCILVVGLVNLIKPSWGGVVIGLGLAFFVDLLWVHYIMVWWNSGGFGLGA